MGAVSNWADFTAPEFKHTTSARTIAVLPVGATEQHGPHLPISVDFDLPAAVIARCRAHVSSDFDLRILPALPFGKSTEHTDAPGTVSLSSATLLAVLADVGTSVARSGIRKLLFLNGHGGNRAVLEIAARDLRAKHGLATFSCSWDDLVDVAAIVGAEEAQHGIHAGDVETSAMLATHPARVRRDLAPNSLSRNAEWKSAFRYIGLGPQRARPGWLMNDLSASGVSGNASAATPEKGAELLEAAARSLARLFEEIDEFTHVGDGL